MGERAPSDGGASMIVGSGDVESSSTRRGKTARRRAGRTADRPPTGTSCGWRWGRVLRIEERKRRRPRTRRSTGIRGSWWSRQLGGRTPPYVVGRMNMWTTSTGLSCRRRLSRRARMSRIVAASGLAFKAWFSPAGSETEQLRLGRDKSRRSSIHPAALSVGR